MLSRILTTIVGITLLLGFAGCGSTTHHVITCASTAGTCVPQRFVAASTSANQLLLFPVQQNGSLGAPTAVTPGPQASAGGIAFSRPSGEIFVADHAGEALFAYNNNGTTYSSAPGSPYPLGSSEGFLESVTVTSDGKFVYVVGLNGGVFGFSIGSNGQLTPIPGSPFPVLISNSVASVTDNLNKFFFVISGSSISPFAVNASTGALSVAAPAFPLSGTNLSTDGMAATTPNNFLYVALSSANGVGAFSFDTSTGALTQVTGSPFPAGKTPLTLTASGNTLYVVNSGDQTLSAFSWDSTTGALTEIGGSPFSAPFAGGTPATLGAGFLYVASVQNVFSPRVNAILGFSIASSGALTPLTGSPFNSNVPIAGGLVAF